MKELKERIARALEDKHPFMMYRKPNADLCEAIFQQNNTTHFTSDYSENGFVFAPFNSDEKTLLIPFSVSDRFSFITDEVALSAISKIKNDVSKTEKEQHKKLVEKGIDFIDNSEVDKVVLSRKEIMYIDDCDIFNIYQKLVANYPTAFVYCWYHPVSGLWMGATPEVLLTIDSEQFKIMSLASTQEYKGSLNVNWNEKEVEEHQIVTDYIVSKFETENLKISETYTVKAGNLVHLRADIFGRISSDNFNLQKLIHVLHPTPAICGMPKDLAKEFILNNEKYNREYYTGFLGEVNSKTIDLFVNLRCMKLDIEQQQAALYVGGGITKNSNPLQEWEETVSKGKVMKKVL